MVIQRSGQPHPETEAKAGNLANNHHNLYSNLILVDLACPARFERATLGFSYRVDNYLLSKRLLFAQINH